MHIYICIYIHICIYQKVRHQRSWLPTFLLHAQTQRHACTRAYTNSRSYAFPHACACKCTDAHALPGLFIYRDNGGRALRARPPLWLFMKTWQCMRICAFTSICMGKRTGTRICVRMCAGMSLRLRVLQERS